MPSEVLHQLMMIVAAGIARLMPPELMSGVHLGNGQGNRSPMMDAMKSDLPSAHRDVQEVIRQQISLGVQSSGGIVRHQLEGLQFLH